MLLIIALLLSFPPVAYAVVNAVGTALNWTRDKIDSISDTVINFARSSVALLLGAFLVSVGAAAAVPIIAISLVVVGVGLFAYGLYNLFAPSGQKPDNVNLGNPD